MIRYHANPGETDTAFTERIQRKVDATGMTLEGIHNDTITVFRPGGRRDPSTPIAFDWPDGYSDRRNAPLGDSSLPGSASVERQRTVIYEPARRILGEVLDVLDERHRKYGPLNVASSPGGPLNGLRVRLFDKLARINHAVDHGNTDDFSDDSFRDAFVDIVGYAVIGLLVLDHQWPEVSHVAPF